MKNNSHLTAIHRRVLPSPTQWIVSQGLIKYPVMDYGCGKCFKVNPITWINYDPYYCNFDLTPFKESFVTIICNYVLCTIPVNEHRKVLKEIQSLLYRGPESASYITVRTDKPKWGWGKSSRGTYQIKVELPFPIVHSNNRFRIYRLTPDSEIV